MIAIFAVVIAIGSLFAWRASPLYSLKATLKVLGVMVIVPFVVWGAVRLIMSPTLAKSVALQAVLGVLAYLIVCTGLSVTIIRITDHHVAQLPPSVRVTNLHRHRIVRWIWRFAAFLLIAAVAAVVVPASWQWLPLLVGAFPLIIGGPLLAILYMMARRNDLGLTEIRNEPWVHWAYSAETWLAWAANQRAWQQAQIAPMKWTKLVLFTLFCMALLAIGPLLAGDFKAGHSDGIIVFSALSSLVVAMMAAIYISTRTSPARAYRRQLLAPPETFFGDEGVFVDGEYLQWTLSGRYLLTAERETVALVPLVPIAGVIVLTFESFNGQTSIKLHKRVPVPQGHEGDLAALQKSLREGCATASVHLLNT